ncbi:hypothetical protein SAMN02927900_05951 [Rhizobium mongolense subsp. loessense]|uniref:Uncharacterized protein n=1 Tax=Rhizobium mongolense subsp. loessense TaxID=158890 RepID=A0A1G4U1C2_9HYPH|nr:hypothetical protein [Rhizobium mongolense]SCW87473.1 hypothetical protein SAMN02927900_05951 [Rhizobium mongolense subsp. loessense]
MSKGGLFLSDFTIAAKSAAKPVPSAGLVGAERPLEEESTQTEADASLAMLTKRTAGEQEKRARDRAATREDARSSLKNLKRAKQREIKFYVNVALDQATKARLKRAADENDLKMATVMKAAIDFYLKENGY